MPHFPEYNMNGAAIVVDEPAILEIARKIGAQVVRELGVRPYLARRVPVVIWGITLPYNRWSEPLATEGVDGRWVPLDPEVEIYWGILPETIKRQNAVNRVVADL